jgi:excisionase family DNA binding protein
MMKSVFLEGFSMDNNKNILSAYDIAQELNVGLNFVYRELKKGTIPSVRIGDRYFVSRDAFQKWLAGDQLKGITNS